MTLWHGISPQDVLRKLGVRSTDPNPARAAEKFCCVVGVQITAEENKPLTVHVRVVNPDKTAELYTLQLCASGWENIVGAF